MVTGALLNWPWASSAWACQAPARAGVNRARQPPEPRGARVTASKSWYQKAGTWKLLPSGPVKRTCKSTWLGSNGLAHLPSVRIPSSSRPKTLAPVVGAARLSCVAGQLTLVAGQRGVGEAVGTSVGVGVGGAAHALNRIS